MVVSIGGKPFLEWNKEAMKKSHPCNHICMFNKPSLFKNVEKQMNYLHSQTALYCRLKTYSTPYHDFLIDMRQDKKDEVLPAGCVEFVCNHLHLSKDKVHIPFLTTLLHHLIPLSFPSSSSTTTSPTPSKVSTPTTAMTKEKMTTLRHNDLFIQGCIKDFSFDYITTANPLVSLPSQQLSVQLHECTAIYYSNFHCPCCPVDAGECLASLAIDDFKIQRGK